MGFLLSVGLETAGKVAWGMPTARLIRKVMVLNTI